MTFAGKKIFLWFTALILILACVPAAAAPVPPAPPLDPNAINTEIAQRANAASTQTKAAIPPTPTFTPTLRSTFTPEPTSTLVPTIVFPTITPIRREQYFRVKHDNQLAVFGYKSRTISSTWGGVDLFTPEVFSLFVIPKPGSGTHRTIVDGSWEVYINTLNNGDKSKLHYLKRNNTALFDGKGFPYLESKTMGGNVVTLIELQGGWGRVNTINYESPGILKTVDYITRPDLVHKFVVVAWDKSTKSTFWTNPPPGDIYWPLVTSQPAWIPLEYLEPFPSLPMVVTANTDQKIRKTPSVKGEETGSKFLVGETARIVKYYPSGPNVWGQLSGGDWIALLLDYKYPTDWKMETVPPP